MRLDALMSWCKATLQPRALNNSEKIAFLLLLLTVFAVKSVGIQADLNQFTLLKKQFFMVKIKSKSAVYVSSSSVFWVVRILMYT